jgi:hypothetical protein
MTGTWTTLASLQRPHDDNCGCEECEMVFHIVRYMLFYMEPTDRALRLPPRRD